MTTLGSLCQGATSPLCSSLLHKPACKPCVPAPCTLRRQVGLTSARDWRTSSLHTVPRQLATRAAPEGKPDTPERPVKYNTEFGYSRKDVFLICGGLIGLGYAMYYGLQAVGVEAGMAGNFVQLAIFVGICIGWVSTYLFRVATKQMTYVKQLEAYEEAVMRKRVEEMTEEELNDLMTQAAQSKNQKQ